MRKIHALGLSLLLVMGLLATGCGKQEEAASSGGDAVTGDVSLRMLNIKAEVDEQIKELAAAYEAETGVHVEVITAGNTIDAQALLKGYYLSDQMPDIIACEASGFGNWEGLLVDMSDQNWASRTSAAYVDDTYGTIGFPYTTEAIGFAYNAEILKVCGVDPTSITGPDAMRAALEAVDAQKDALGLRCVVDIALEPEGVGWSPGNHLFGVYIDSGLARDDTTYIDGIATNHSVDASRFANFTNMIQMFYQYADQDLMMNGSYDDQVGTFAEGKAAFITQGSWIGASMTSNPNYSGFEVGMAPYAFEDGMNTILTSAPSWWGVFKEGNIEASEAFLQWCSEDKGQQILVEKAGFVSPFTDCSYVAADPFAPVLSSYVAEGRTSDWHWMQLPSGIGNSEGGLCYCFYRFAAGEEDAGGFMTDINQTLEAWYAKQ